MNVAVMDTLSIVNTQHGKIHIHDFKKLKGLSCNCNDLVCSHFGEVLKGVYPDLVD